MSFIFQDIFHFENKTFIRIVKFQSLVKFQSFTAQFQVDHFYQDLSLPPSKQDNTLGIFIVGYGEVWYGLRLMQQKSVDETHFGRPWCQRHGSGRMCLVSGHTSSLRGPFPQALTLLGGVRFIPWRLKRLFLGNYLQGPRRFEECQARLGYDPAPGPTLKIPYATLVRLVGRPTNTTGLCLSKAHWV